MLFPIKNEADILGVIDELQGIKISTEDSFSDLSNDVLEIMDKGGAEQVWITDAAYQPDLQDVILNPHGPYVAMLSEKYPSIDNEIMHRLFVERYWYLVKKEK